MSEPPASTPPDRDPTTGDLVFAEFAGLVSGDVEVEVAERRPADPSKGYVPAYECRILRRADRCAVGTLSLRIGNPQFVVMYGGHLGYTVDPQHRGHRYAAHGCLAVRPIALHHGLTPLWITVEPHNRASRRTCEIIGATFVETVDLPPDCDMFREGQRHKCRYRWDLAAVDRGASRPGT